MIVISGGKPVSFNCPDVAQTKDLCKTETKTETPKAAHKETLNKKGK